MSNLPQLTVTEGAYLTLHYRLASVNGDSIINTFDGKPATLQLGTGQLAPFLEACLIGLPEGARQTFELPAELAFGVRNPDLIRPVSRQMLNEHSQIGEEYGPGDLVEFNSPGGGRFAGALVEWKQDYALFDFNHPLAGQSLQFEVKIIGIL